MKTIKGKIEKSELEGGIWVLVTDKGEQYQLDGGDRELYIQGRKVSVTGTEQRDMMGIGMMGPLFKVKKYEILR
ncbi:MAG: DUF5818 domain-containing protein [Candidatus Eremiobacteraeota bacterium]|nr:DUF5818 domain-containing protein [Candidatus Eremiobacteraeota bacterium]